MKLQLFLSHNGACSRRKAFDAIMEGEVAVNGCIVQEPSTEINPLKDEIRYHGQKVGVKTYDYIIMNKPKGYVTTVVKQFDQRIILNLLPPELRHVKPVGRLDKDTEGLILLTNDGELANKLAHPSFDINKTYAVRARGRLTANKQSMLEKGVVVEGWKTAPAEVKDVKFDGDNTEFLLTIHEGRKRQVRYMAMQVGLVVTRLTRISQGPLKLDNLRSAAWRRLTEEELTELKKIKRSAFHAPAATPARSRRSSSDKHERRPASSYRPAAKPGFGPKRALRFKRS